VQSAVLLPHPLASSLLYLQPGRRTTSARREAPATPKAVRAPGNSRKGSHARSDFAVFRKIRLST
jgi:hypothetical protein